VAVAGKSHAVGKSRGGAHDIFVLHAQDFEDGGQRALRAVAAAKFISFRPFIDFFNHFFFVHLMIISMVIILVFGFLKILPCPWWAGTLPQPLPSREG